MGDSQGITRHVRPHLALTQDEVGEHGEHCLARRALEAPDGDPTQPDPRRA
jgi:hypothetical protein